MIHSPLPFDPLPADYPRRYVPAEARLSDWEQVEPLFDELDSRELGSVEELEQWLLDTSELASVFMEEASRLHIATTLDTEDEQAAAAHARVTQEVLPRWSARSHALAVRYAGSELRSGLDPSRYAVMDKLRVESIGAVESAGSSA